MRTDAVPVREFASVHDMKAHYRALHRATFAPRPVPEPKRPAFVPRADPAPIPPPDRGLTISAAKASRDAFLEATRSQRVESLKILQVMRVVAAVSGIHVCAIKGACQMPKVVKARHIAMYLATATAGASLPFVGKHLGGRDHTTVLYAKRKVQALVDRLGLRDMRDAVEVASILWKTPWDRKRKASS